MFRWIKNSAPVSRTRSLLVGRNLKSIFGYQDDPKYADFMEKYKRQDVAKRIIDVFPDIIWSPPPQFLNDNGEPVITVLEPFWGKLRELDKLARLGTYACLVIGYKDGKTLDTPVGKAIDIDYMFPVGEGDITISQTETSNKFSPRFGQPLYYEIRMTTNGVFETVKVHYSRVLHVSRNRLGSSLKGIPMLLPIMNRLDDLNKVIGGASEIFYLNGRGGLHVNIPEGADPLSDTELLASVQNYKEGLSRVLVTQNLEAQTIDQAVPSPKEHVDSILDLIAGCIGIPKRILTGSERGELASSQDENNFLSRVEEERYNFSQKEILEPLLAELQKTGIIDLTLDRDYTIAWEPLGSPTEETKANIMQKRAMALASYVNSNGAEMVIPPKQFVEEVLGLTYMEEDLED